MSGFSAPNGWWYATERLYDAEIKGQRAERFGRSYFAVYFDKGEEAYLFADRAEILPGGTLAFYGGFRKEKEEPKTIELLSAFPAGTWKEFHAVSVLDATPILVADDDRIWRKNPAAAK
jgi:hypothetical protein